MDESLEATRLALEYVSNRADELLGENVRLRAALDLICHIQYKKETHLGRARSSDLNCIFCVAYLAMNYGAYGERLEKEDFDEAKEMLAGCPPHAHGAGNPYCLNGCGHKFEGYK